MAVIIEKQINKNRRSELAQSWLSWLMSVWTMLSVQAQKAQSLINSWVQYNS